MWLRRTGLGEALRARVAAGRPVLAICGGYQMLARSIEDEVESRAGLVDGLGLRGRASVEQPGEALQL